MVGDFCLVDVLEAFFKLILRANKVCSIIAMIRQRDSKRVNQEMNELVFNEYALTRQTARDDRQVKRQPHLLTFRRKIVTSIGPK